MRRLIALNLTGLFLVSVFFLGGCAQQSESVSLTPLGIEVAQGPEDVVVFGPEFLRKLAKAKAICDAFGIDIQKSAWQASSDDETNAFEFWVTKSYPNLRMVKNIIVYFDATVDEALNEEDLSPIISDFEQLHSTVIQLQADLPGDVEFGIRSGDPIICADGTQIVWEMSFEKGRDIKIELSCLMKKDEMVDHAVLP